MRSRKRRTFLRTRNDEWSAARAHVRHMQASHILDIEKEATQDQVIIPGVVLSLCKTHRVTQDELYGAIYSALMTANKPKDAFQSVNTPISLSNNKFKLYVISDMHLHVLDADGKQKVYITIHTIMPNLKKARLTSLAKIGDRLTSVHLLGAKPK